MGRKKPYLAGAIPQRRSMGRKKPYLAGVPPATICKNRWVLCHRFFDRDCAMALVAARCSKPSRVVSLAGVVVFTAPAANQEGAPIVVTEIPPGDGF
jgi:hypothetical protein